jgi:uncharacterized protein (DUF1015 family)
MAEIRPFRAVRYDAAAVGDLATVLAPPYDVISPEHQEALYARSPHNIVRLEYGRADPDDTPANNCYTRAAAEYHAWLEQGMVRLD